MKKSRILFSVATSLLATLPVANAHAQTTQKPKISISSLNHAKGSYDVVVSNISNIKEVLIPTWTKHNGQDDLVWHVAKKQKDGSYRYTVTTSEHKNENGQYISHVYIRDAKNNLTYASELSVNLVTPQQKSVVSIQNVNDKNRSYDVVISNISVPSAIKEILVPTWTKYNGQDDLVWHVAKKQKDGSYRYTVTASEHKNEYGTYISHIYLRNHYNKLTHVSSQSVTFKQPKLTATASIQKIDTKKGTYDVVVSHINVPSAVKEVLVPTWTKHNGQDDLIWYVANKQKDGSYRYTVNAADHNYETGTYISHVYIKDTQGNLQSALVPNPVTFTKSFENTLPIRSVAGTSTNVLSWSWNYPSTQARQVLNDNYGMYMKGDNVYITFDNGYEYQNLSSSLLDTLKAKNIKAVFFTTGHFMKENPELTRRMIREGHTVGNHTNQHLSPREVSPERIAQDIKEWEDIYKQVVGQLPKIKLYRPPYGHFSERTVRLASNMGYKTVLWGLAYKDWETNNQPSEQFAFDTLTRNTQKGDIVLLHSISRTNARILGRYIDWLRNNHFVIGELK